MNKDRFHTDITYCTPERKTPKKFIDFNKQYFDAIPKQCDPEDMKKIIKRFQYDYQISPRKILNKKQLMDWKLYWLNNH